MAVKTFGSEILTSGDVNTYLANSGLVYVTSQTIGSGVSSVTVSNAFNSTYDNYRVIVSGSQFSATDTTLSFKFENGGLTTYYSSGQYVLFTGAGNGFSSNNGTAAGIGVGITSNYSSSALVADVFSPFLAAYTVAIGQSVGSSYVANYQGVMKTATSYSQLIVLPASGTMTGGVITVYGYRKA